MSAPNFTPIQVYRSATPGAVPLAGNLAAGELALNTADQKLFFKNAGGTVVNIDTANGTVTSVSGTGTVNGITLTGTVTSSGSLTLGGTLSGVSLTSQVSGTLPVANGGTGVTSSTGTVAVVLSNTPTLVTPILGVASATSIATGLGLVGTPAYTFTGDLNTGMWSPAADTVAVSTGGAEAMRINSGGNVGIGTSAPSATLNIIGTTNPAVDLDYYETGTGGASYRGRKARGTVASPTAVASNDYISTLLASGYGATGFGGSIGLLGFRANQNFTDTARGTNIVFENTPDGSTTRAERMRILSGGNVGIGTSAPSVTLDVAGTIRSVRNNAEVRTTTATGYGWRMGTTSSASTLGYMFFQGTTDNFATSFIDGMAIDTSGRVGIGTTTPNAKLHVEGGSVRSSVSLIVSGAGSVQTSIAGSGLALNSSGANGIAIETGATPVERVRFDNAGNVGIGTSAPLTKLDVAGVITIKDNSAATNGTSITSDSSGNTSITQFYSGYMRFGTNNTERMRIDSTGNVGIGTSAPGYKLDVYATGNISGQFKTSGSINALFLADAGTTAETLYIGTVGNDFRVVTGSNERMRIDSTGNVGINAVPVAGYGNSVQLRQVGSSATSALLHQAVDVNVQNLELLNNALPPAGGYTAGYNYTATGASATKYLSQAGNHIWFNAPTGTAGAAVTFSERMRIDSTGNVGIGTSAPVASAILDVQSTTKGVRMPNMTTTQKNAISSPAAGLMVFDTSLARLCVYIGSAWQTLL